MPFRHSGLFVCLVVFLGARRLSGITQMPTRVSWCWRLHPLWHFSWFQCESACGLLSSFMFLLPLHTDVQASSGRFYH